MFRNVPRLPAAMLAAAVSGLLLALVGAAAPATARASTASATDARPSADRATATAKATLHKLDVGARAHHEQTGLGPDVVALPPSDLRGGSGHLAEATADRGDTLRETAASPLHSRAPPR